MKLMKSSKNLNNQTRNILTENQELINDFSYSNPLHDRADFNFEKWMIGYLKQYQAAGEDDLNTIYNYVESYQAPNRNNKINLNDF